jgi:hypothetical protein
VVCTNGVEPMPIGRSVGAPEAAQTVTDETRGSECRQSRERTTGEREKRTLGDEIFRAEFNSA